MQEKAYIEEGDDSMVNMDDHEGALKDFFKEVEDIRNDCNKIDTKVKEIKKLQSEILGSPTVEPKHKQQMDDYMAEIKRFANNCRSKLKKMETETEAEEKARGQVTGELRIKKTQHMTTSRRFVEVMEEYNKVQVSNVTKNSKIAGLLKIIVICIKNIFIIVVKCKSPSLSLSQSPFPPGRVPRAEQGQDRPADGALREGCHRRGA